MNHKNNENNQISNYLLEKQLKKLQLGGNNNSYNLIQNPLNKEYYNINSEKGMKVLNLYLKQYNEIQSLLSNK